MSQSAPKQHRARQNKRQGRVETAVLSFNGTDIIILTQGPSERPSKVLASSSDDWLESGGEDCCKASWFRDA